MINYLPNIELVIQYEDNLPNTTVEHLPHLEQL